MNFFRIIIAFLLKLTATTTFCGIQCSVATSSSSSGGDR